MYIGQGVPGDYPLGMNGMNGGFVDAVKSGPLWFAVVGAAAGYVMTKDTLDKKRGAVTGALAGAVIGFIMRSAQEK